MKKLFALLLTSVAAYAIDVTISWNPSPTSEGVTQYRIYSSQSPLGLFSLAGTSETTNFVTTVSIDAPTYFVVTAVNSFGESDPSSVAYLNSTNIVIPSAPSGIVVSHPFVIRNVINVTINAGDK